MTLPTREQAQRLMQEAERLNPGPWVRHSWYAAETAYAIAQRHPALEPESAWIMSYLHDIGRRAGKTAMRHTLDGYAFLMEQGFDTAARVCITHAFLIKDLQAVACQWDCSAAEMAFLETFLAGIEFDLYDQLIQLCDAIALPTGFCLMEKRLIDVAMRHGVNDRSIERWQAFLGIQKDFEAVIGCSIYTLLPGVVDNTFGFESGVLSRAE